MSDLCNFTHYALNTEGCNSHIDQIVNVMRGGTHLEKTSGEERGHDEETVYTLPL